MLGGQCQDWLGQIPAGNDQVNPRFGEPFVFVLEIGERRRDLFDLEVEVPDRFVEPAGPQVIDTAFAATAECNRD